MLLPAAHLITCTRTCFCLTWSIIPPPQPSHRQAELCLSVAGLWITALRPFWWERKRGKALILDQNAFSQLDELFCPASCLSLFFLCLSLHVDRHTSLWIIMEAKCYRIPGKWKDWEMGRQNERQDASRQGLLMSWSLLWCNNRANIIHRSTDWHHFLHWDWKREAIFVTSWSLIQKDLFCWRFLFLWSKTIHFAVSIVCTILFHISLPLFTRRQKGFLQNCKNIRKLESDRRKG